MLTRLAIKNFKSIGDPGLDLELKPLTVLVGPNGAGKSSVLEALAFIAQNATSPNTSGPYFFFNSIADLLHRTETRTAEPMELTLAEHELLFSIVCYHNRVDINDRTILDAPELQGRQLPKLLQWPHTVFRTISSQRGALVPRFAAGALTGWVGLKGEELPIVEHKLQEDLVRYAEAKKWGLRFGLLETRSEWLGKNELGSYYRDSVLGSELPKSSASFGGRQAWVIVVQLFASLPGHLISIEEPEISLHPQAQVDMAELLATAAAEGKQILATTHSTFLLLGLSKAIRAGVIPADKVAIYEITKGSEGSVARPLPVDENGDIQGWADSEFGKVEQGLLADWVKSLPEE